MKIRKVNNMKHTSIVFIVMSICISWLFWSPIIGSDTFILRQRIAITSAGGFILYIIAMTSMWIAALPLIVAEQGIEGVKNAYKGLFSGVNSALWFIVAVLVPPAIEIAVPEILALLAGNPDSSSLRLSYVFFVLLLGIHLAFVLALGGTGYALRLFAKTHGRHAATFISSAYTMVWMAPMYVEVALRNPGYPALWYCLGFTPGVVMIVWLYHAAKIS